MSTNNEANHPNRFKRMAEPARDPGYPPMDYYERQERESEEQRRLNEEAEAARQRRNT